jgi:hypothetical protein
MCINITSLLDWFNNDFLYLFEAEPYHKESSYIKEEHIRDLEIFEEYNWDII